MNFSYKQLIVWQKAMALVRLVYLQTKSFPQEERYSLTDQLRRAVVSIPSNIAEGNGRAGNKDYSHFLSIARGSLYETLTQLEIAYNLGYMEENRDILDLALEIGNMLSAMLKKYGSISTNKKDYPSTVDLDLEP